MRKNPFMNNEIQRRQLPGERLAGMNAGAKEGGFTLLEMLVATFVLVIILGLTLQITTSANNLFLGTRKRIDAFQEARAGFEVMTRRVSQAMLNTYWDYANGTVGSGTGAPRPSPDADYSTNNYATLSGTWQPTQYLPNSGLHFICGPVQAAITQSGTTVGPIVGTSVNTVASPVKVMVGDAIFFQAPLGYSNTSSNAVMPDLLNSCGYFLQFSSDNPDRPAFLTGTEKGVSAAGSDSLPVRFRFRLKELDLPSQYMYVYQYISQYSAPQPGPTVSYPNYTFYWFSYPLAGLDSNQQPLPFNPVYTLAQNVIALIIEPVRSSNYPSPNPATVELAPYYFYNSRLWADATKTGPTAAATSPLAIATRNQLPPQVMVTMVAIDEASAARLQALQTTMSTMPTFSDAGAANSTLPNGLYNTSGVPQVFLQASTPPQDAVLNSTGTGYVSANLNNQYQTDLANLEQALVNEHITYRVFSTNITILQAKFSN